MRILTKALILLLALCLTAAAAAEPAETPDFLGTLEGSTYENPYMGFGCTLEGWVFQEDYDRVQEAAESISEKAGEMTERVRERIELVAKSRDNTQAVTVSVQDTGPKAELYGLMGLEFFTGQYAALAAGELEAAGMENTQAEAAQFELQGRTFPGVREQYEIKGIPAWVKQLWLLQDSYLCMITVTAFHTDTTDEILKNFYLMK